MPQFFESAAREYDVIIANVLGTGVMFHTPVLREVVANDTQRVLRVLQLAAAANANKRLVVTTTPTVDHRDARRPFFPQRVRPAESMSVASVRRLTS